MDITSLDKPWVKVVAVAVFVGAIALLFFANQKPAPNFLNNSFITLSEGSTVEARKAGYILNGKAYFQMQEDSIIRVFSDVAFVIADSASFQVTNSADMEVIVESGTVELVRVKPNVSSKISAGEVGVAKAFGSVVIKRNNSDAQYLDWTKSD